MPGSEIVATLTAAWRDVSMFQAFFVYLENALDREPSAIRAISQVDTY
jgi:hypothetical protein